MYSSSLFQSLYTSKSSQYKLDTIVSHFLDLLQMKSRNLYEHAIRVSNHSAATAVYMRLPTDDIRLIRAPKGIFTFFKCFGNPVPSQRS